MAKALTPQQFEKLFNQVYRSKTAARREAVGTLEPGVMRDALRTGQPLPVEFGVKPDGEPFTRKDLLDFAKRKKQMLARFGKKQRGLTLNEIEKRCLGIDRQRAKRQIRNATLIRVEDGNVLKFQVTASPKSKHRFHRVTIRLEAWGEEMRSMTHPVRAVKNIIYRGRLSWECSCGRHQYWYRYLATILDAGIKPLERAYPKIRNPRLKGIACKHAMKVFANLQSPAVQNLLANKMKRQADAVSFADDEARFLSGKELRSMRASKADVSKAYRRYQADIRKRAQQRRAEEAKVKKTEIKKMAEKEARRMQLMKKEFQRFEKDLKKTGFTDRKQIKKFFLSANSNYTAEDLDRIIK